MIAIREKVRFVETDMMGVVHHANYLHWLEMSRVEYLRACGVMLDELMDNGIVFPITDVELKYKNSCAFDDEVEVQTVMCGLNKAKMEFTYKVIRLRDGAVAVEGRTRNVFTDREGHIIRLPAKWFDKMKQAYDKEQGHEEQKG